MIITLDHEPELSIKLKPLSASLRLCGNKFLKLATFANIARQIQIYDTQPVFKRLDQHGK